MPAVITENPVRAGMHLVSEASGYRSREVGLLAQNATPYRTAEVLGRVTASGKLTHLAPTATDGSQNATAVLYMDVDASAADTPATITARDAEVNGLILVWPAGVTVAQKAAAVSQLAALGVIVRT